MANPGRKGKDRKIKAPAAPPAEGAGAQGAAPGGGPALGGAEQAAEEQPQKHLTPWLAFWLAMTIVNIILLALLIPSAEFDNPRTKLLIEFLPWVATLLISGVVFRARFLSFFGSRLYATLNAFLFGALLILHASRFPLVRVGPRVEPRESLIQLDTEEPEPFKGPFRVSLSHHTVKVIPPGGVEPREFKLELTDVLSSAIEEYDERWQPLYVVTIDTAEPRAKVTVRKLDDRFDADFRAKPPLPAPGRPVSFGSDDTLSYAGDDLPDGSADKIKLPYGRYEITKEACGRSQTLPLEVGEKGPTYVLAFNVLCVTGRQ